MLLSYKMRHCLVYKSNVDGRTNTHRVCTCFVSFWQELNKQQWYPVCKPGVNSHEVVVRVHNNCPGEILLATPDQPLLFTNWYIAIIYNWQETRRDIWTGILCNISQCYWQFSEFHPSIPISPPLRTAVYLVSLSLCDWNHWCPSTTHEFTA